MAKQYSVRIIAGSFRGRKVNFTAENIRPTPDRIRETLFNWLQPILPGARVLDCYSGSGVLALEACSRGASEVVAIEQDKTSARNIAELGEEFAAEQLQVLQTDCIAYLSKPATQLFDIVFCDPPYAADLMEKSLALLHDNHWLNTDARVYCESDRKLNPLFSQWQVLKDKKAGQVYYYLLSLQP